MKRRFPAQSPLRRIAASVAAVSALTLASACSNPIQTNEPYNAADGVPATIGKVALRDLLLVSDGNGPAVVSGSAINEGDAKVTLELSPEAQSTQGGTASSAGTQVEVGPFEQVNLSTKGLQLGGADAKPGTLAAVIIRSSDGGSTIVRLPVLPATGPYSTITPAG